MEPNKTEKKSNIVLSSTIVIILILIIGGIYFWKTNQEEKSDTPNTDMSSDDIASIETELNDIDLDSLDEGI